MRVINTALVTRTGMTLVVEASTAGLAPGEWPDFIGVVDGRGCGNLFGPCSRPLPDGGRAYSSRTTALELHVLND